MKYTLDPRPETRNDAIGEVLYSELFLKGFPVYASQGSPVAEYVLNRAEAEGHSFVLHRTPNGELGYVIQMPTP